MESIVSLQNLIKILSQFATLTHYLAADVFAFNLFHKGNKRIIETHFVDFIESLIINYIKVN